MDEMTDLRQVTVNFVMNLPVTIRGYVLMFVILYAAQAAPPIDPEDYALVVRNFLFDTKAWLSFGRLLCTIAVIDHVLADRVANA